MRDRSSGSGSTQARHAWIQSPEQRLVQRDSHQGMDCAPLLGVLMPSVWRRATRAVARCKPPGRFAPSYVCIRTLLASSLSWSLESDVFLWLQMGTGVPQQTTMLNWANLSERAQKIKGLNFCASQVCAHRINAFVCWYVCSRPQCAKLTGWRCGQFVTEDEVKYCVAKLFEEPVKFATAADY